MFKLSELRENHFFDVETQLNLHTKGVLKEITICQTQKKVSISFQAMQKENC